MRLTVNLEPAAYDFACAYSRGRGITFSAALNELLREAERIYPFPTDPSRLKLNDRGYYVITGDGPPLTLEMVKEASEDDLVSDQSFT
jgi:hypothetical protein